jgi:uncharacterized repeat protein (TIGR03803 family)
LRIFARYALSIGAAAVLLAGCGGSQPPIGGPGAMPQVLARAPRSSYRVVYSFGALPDGSNPQASLTDVGGTLYGTTEYGGANSCEHGYSCGTVFSITADGTEKVLHSFGPPPDGAHPVANLLDAGGTLYGTTNGGGAHRGGGTVFNVSTAGAESVLYSFNGANGKKPEAGLIDVNGTFYGTTTWGGLRDCGESGAPLIGCGTVYRVTPSGKQSVVFRFTGGGQGSGWSPQAGLIDAGGTLYGTTVTGGRHIQGVVYSLTTSGTEKVLHSFGNGRHVNEHDGIYPEAGLIHVNGAFYGTTHNGGAHNCGSIYFGCGTVFSITPSGTEKVIHSFGYGTDGSQPIAGLIDVNGTLYGTTSKGGTYSCQASKYGCGTVFSITPDGKEKVLHSFGSGTDGSTPNAGLIDVNGTLYGTTSEGGTNNNGTVFALTP